jgi:predicted  nucleic acid-binding Zn-ribbon protein
LSFGDESGMRNNIVYQLILFILFLLLIPLSSGELVEFHTTAGVVANFYGTSGAEAYNVCAYDLHNDYVTIRNQGNVHDTYYITIISNDAVDDWVTVVEPVVMLQPGEERSVPVYTKTPAEIVGEYEYTIVITSTYDSVKHIEKTVTVEACGNLALSTYYTGQETCPCSTAVYMFELVNSGALPEDYTLWIEGIDPDYYELSEYYVTLHAGERLTVYGYVRLPCDVYGDYDLQLRTESAHSNYEAILPLQLYVEQACYNYNIGLGEALIFSAEETLDVTFTSTTTLDYVLCEESPALIPVYMQNPSDILNDFHVYVQDGAPWITAAEPYIRLSSMQEYTTSLVVNTAAATPGFYSFALKVDADRGNLETVVPFTVEVVDCDGSSVDTMEVWLQWLLWLLLLLLILAIVGVGTLLALKDRDKKGTTKGTKTVANKHVKNARTWVTKRKLWLVPLLLLLILLLLLAAVAWPIVKQKYEDRTTTIESESRIIDTLLYEWATLLILLLLLLLLAFLAWWFRFCDKKKRKLIIEKVKNWFRKMWEKIKLYMKWVWIILLLLLLLLGLIAGMYFLYNNYKEDAKNFLDRALDDDLSELEERMDVLEEELDTMEDNVDGEVLEGLENELEELRDELERLRGSGNAAEIEVLEEKVTELEEKVSTLRDAQNALIKLKEELEALQEKIEEKEDAIRALEEKLLEAIEKAALADNEEELEKLMEEIESLQKDIEALEAELAELYEQRTALLDSIDDLETKIEALEDQIRSLEDEITALDEQIATLQNLVAQLTAENVADDVVEDVEEEIDSLEEEKEELEEEKETLQEVSDVLKTVDVEAIPEIVDNDFKTVVVFDVSLSGQIVEEGKSRFERGIEEAQKFIQEKGEYTIMIIGKNALIIRRNIESDVAIRVLRNLRPLDTQSNLGKALVVAADDIGDKNGRIVLVSDLVTTDGVDISALRDDVEDTGIEVVFLNVALEEDVLETEGNEVEQGETGETTEEESETQETVASDGPIFDVASQTTGSFFIEIPKNMQYVLDLDTYFNDEDGDVLTYSADVGDHLTAVLEGSGVTLIPETDWVGDSGVSFSAADGKGGSVDSPLIRVSVIDVEDASYLPHVIIGSIILLIIVSLVFGAFAKKFEDPGIPPEGE